MNKIVLCLMIAFGLSNAYAAENGRIDSIDEEKVKALCNLPDTWDSWDHESSAPHTPIAMSPPSPEPEESLFLMILG